MTHSTSFKYDLELEPGCFVDYRHVASQSPGKHMTTQPNFGLLSPTGSESQGEADAAAGLESAGKPSWQVFVQHVQAMNQDSPKGVQYKVVFLTRHARGVHNVAESKYGTEAWDNHWARLDGDGTFVWSDAELAEDGLRQAAELRQIWADAVAQDGVPIPGSFYTSPLRRCLETTKIVFSQFPDVRPTVKELLRESLCDHTCDRRSPRSWTASNYTNYVIEPGFTEEDELWSPDFTETLDQHAARKHKVLEEIFATNSNLVISLTIHSGAISAILKATNAEDFRVREGSTIAVLVKATEVRRKVAFDE